MKNISSQLRDMADSFEADTDFFSDFKRKSVEKILLAEKHENYKKAALIGREIKSRAWKDKEEKKSMLLELISLFMECAINKKGFLEPAAHSIIEVWKTLSLDEQSEFDYLIVKHIIEPLKDSFGREEDEIYLQFFSLFIDAASKKSSKLKELFTYLDLDEERAGEFFIRRYFKSLQKRHTLTHEEKKNVMKVFVLSRGTIGADALISSIVLSRVAKELPKSEIIFIDSLSIGKEMFNFPNVKHISDFTINGELRNLAWQRKAFSLLNRIEYALDLLECIHEETKKLSAEQYLILDTNTRLSQTGILPLGDLRSYFFMSTYLSEEEEYYAANLEYDKVSSLGDITNIYLNRIFGVGSRTFPEIAPSKSDLHKISSLYKKFSLDKDFSVLVHFGGEPESKYLSLDFEKSLVINLIEKGIKPIIINTPVPREKVKIKSIIEFLNKNGVEVVNINSEENSRSDKSAFLFEGSLGELTSLIKISNFYIGYDSLGQHLSSAVGTPLATIFTGHINKVFLKRWTPFGRGFSKIIEIDKKIDLYDSEKDRKKSDEKTLGEIFNYIEEYRKSKK